MAKYPISREFFPFSKFKPPMSPWFVKLAQLGMKNPPGFLWKDPELTVEQRSIPGYQDGEILLYILSPKGLPEPAPCLVNIHGGGFVLEGAFSHYRIAMTYAKEARCKVIFVRYRLTPAHAFPTPQEDCYAALCWAYDHADELGIDREKIGVAGDSAGGTLTVTSCMMARDRGAAVRPLFQLLVYPWLDGRNESESYRRFTDTPMWNSTLSKKVGPMMNPQPENTPLCYRSPVEADSHADLPPAYVEVAEFDCLHDDGVLYAQLLRDSGVDAELHETEGTMHGFDTVVNAPTSQKMIAQRCEYMRRKFQGAEKPKVAFVCVHNSCRSQIAEALGKHLAADVFHSYSAGTETKPQINQDAVRLMKQLYGIDMEKTQHSKLLTDIPSVDVVITMGCNVNCPNLPCSERQDWGLEDPTGKPDEAFVETIRQIEEKILALKEQLQ